MNRSMNILDILFSNDSILRTDLESSNFTGKIALYISIPIFIVLMITQQILYPSADHPIFIAVITIIMLLSLVFSLFSYYSKLLSKNRFRWVSLGFQIFVLCFYVLLIHLLVVENQLSRVPWIYVFPVVTLYSFGLKRGLIILIAFFLTVFFIIFNVDFELPNADALFTLKTRFIITFSISGMSIVLVFAILRSKQKKLSNEILAKVKAETELRSLLEQRDLLMKEMQHRVKNNFQFVMSFLHLEGSSAGDPKVTELLSKVINRIHTMVYVHDRLYRVDNQDYVNLPAYLYQIASDLTGSFGMAHINVEEPSGQVKYFADVDNAITCGLVTNEIITNSLKYAFTDRDKGRLSITFEPIENGYQLILQDDGKGMQTDTLPKNGSGLGFEIIKSLIRQMRATFKRENVNGLSYIITFGPDSRLLIHEERET
jgi:two-component sensor histidine kinase